MPHPLVSCMMPGIAVLTIITAILLGFHLWQRTLPADTTVPMLAGTKVEDAISALHAAGLDPEQVKSRQSSEEIPEDYVISSTPDGGRRVKAGRIVLLLVSSGSAYTTVPDVRELPQEAARERLQTDNLVVAQEDYAFHPNIPFDRIINITPKPGTRVEKLSTVKLVISKGPDVPESTSGPAGVPEVKSTVISVALPTDGDPRDMVRIDVSDESGDRTVFQKEYNAGDTVVQTVEGKGDVTAKVYYGNRLILTRTF